MSIPRLRTERLILREFAANIASLRVAEHLGMKHEVNVELFGKPLGRWAR